MKKSRLLPFGLACFFIVTPAAGQSYVTTVDNAYNSDKQDVTYSFHDNTRVADVGVTIDDTQAPVATVYADDGYLDIYGCTTEGLGRLAFHKAVGTGLQSNSWWWRTDNSSRATQYGLQLRESGNGGFAILSLSAGDTIKITGLSIGTGSDQMEFNFPGASSVDGVEQTPVQGDGEADFTVTRDGSTGMTIVVTSDGYVASYVTSYNYGYVYDITITEDKPAISGSKIAYVYDSQYDGYSLDNDIIRTAIVTQDNSSFASTTIEDIDISGDGSAIGSDSLINYDVVVVTGAVAADNAYATTLQEALGFVPMVSFNSNLYSTWGYGEQAATSSGTVTVSDDYIDDELLQPSDISTPDYVQDGAISLFDGSFTGVKLADDTYFSDDDIVAYDGDVVAIHIHNPDRNAYIYLPYGVENTSFNVENILDIVTNAIVKVNSTRTSITQAATPTFSEEYKQMNTDVTITSATPRATIYYTTDGTDPTDESSLYTGAVNVAEEGVTIKAIAYADGYYTSNIGSLTVSIYETSEPPTVSYTKDGDKTVVTITNNESGATLFYNFKNSSDSTASQVYTEPLTVTKPSILTAFAGATEGRIQSERITEYIPIEGMSLRLDVIGHMDANRNSWCPDGSSTYYYFGRSGYSYYTDEILGIDDEGNITFAPADSLSVYDPGDGWELKTYGQPCVWQNLSATTNIGDVSGYNPATVYDDDGGITSNSIQFARNSNTDGDGQVDPVTACLQSTTAYQAPFDVVGYISGNDSVAVGVYVAVDTLDENSWVKVGEMYSPNLGDSSGRTWQKNIVSYDGTDEVFVKIAAIDNAVIRVFDIYIKNEGEETAQYVTGIKDVSVSNGRTAEGNVVATFIYNVSGTQLNSLAKGINIVKKVYENGVVETKKVVVK